MDLLQLVDLLELGSTEQKTSYAKPLKLVALGRVMGLNPNTKVIDYGCAKGQALILWAKYFGISGLGIEKSDHFCQVAEQRILEQGLSGRLEIVCADASAYPVPSHAYDVACCIGASFIWGGFRATLRVLEQTIRAGGQIVIGEPYYTQENVPRELIEFEGNYHTEERLLQIVNEEGCDLKQIFRASSDDKDWYTAFWSQRGQAMYLKYMRVYEGWAMYLIHPSA
jgi:cyclopropane fatty-acyl-phospholipid synthase-like methyltransferase